MAHFLSRSLTLILKDGGTKRRLYTGNLDLNAIKIIIMGKLLL